MWQAAHCGVPGSAVRLWVLSPCLLILGRRSNTPPRKRRTKGKTATPVSAGATTEAIATGYPRNNNCYSNNYYQYHYCYNRTGSAALPPRSWVERWHSPSWHRLRYLGIGFESISAGKGDTWLSFDSSARPFLGVWMRTYQHDSTSVRECMCTMLLWPLCMLRMGTCGCRYTHVHGKKKRSRCLILICRYANANANPAGWLRFYSMTHLCWFRIRWLVKNGISMSLSKLSQQ